MSGKKKDKKAKSEKRGQELFATVGELVLISTALDHLLNRVLIAVLHLGDAPLIEPVVATLDATRKAVKSASRVEAHGQAALAGRA